MTDQESPPETGRPDPHSQPDPHPRSGPNSQSGRSGGSPRTEPQYAGPSPSPSGAATDGGVASATADGATGSSVASGAVATAPESASAPKRLPTRTSGWIAAVAAASFIVVLLYSFPVIRMPFLFGAGGAICLALGIRLARRYARPPVTFAAALLAVPIAIGLFGGPFLVGIGLIDTIFPVPDPSLLSLGSLVILSYMAIVLGCSVTVLGLALGGFTVVTPGSLDRFSSAIFVAGIPPAVISILLAGSAIVGGAPGEAGIVSHLAGLVVGRFLSTVPASLNLGSFLLVVAAAILGLRLCLSTLPVSELLSDTGLPGERVRAVEQAKTPLTMAFVATAGLGTIALALEIFLPHGGLAGVVGPALADLVRLLTTAGAVRFLLLVLTVVSFAAAGAGYIIRRFTRASSLTVRNRLTALVAGTVIAALAIGSSEFVYAAIVDEIAGRLPTLIAPIFEKRTAELAMDLGDATIIVLMTAILVGATGFGLLVLRGLLGAGLVSPETPGYSLAGGGLFLAILFAAPVGLDSWLVFAGVAGSLLVWDVGRFGSTLAREIGRDSAHRSTDLVHATGTILVGIVGVLAALAASSLIGTRVAPAADSHLVALGFLLVGLLGLVEALRLS